MADYSNSKSTIGMVSPENAIASAWDHLEPVLTPQQLRVRHLFGVPLVSKMRDPLTGMVQVMTDEILQDFIVRSMSLAKDEAHIDIMPVQRREKHPFDQTTFRNFGYLEAKHRPVCSVERFSVVPADGRELYVVPNNWIETANAIRGQINVIPINIALTGGVMAPAGNVGGSLYLSIINMCGWVPAFWQLEYTSGFPAGLVPREINELIGTIAASEILSMLAATDADATGRSIGIDGMSQSVSGPGADKFRARLEQLAQKRSQLVGKLRAQFGTKMFISWV